MKILLNPTHEHSHPPDLVRSPPNLGRFLPLLYLSPLLPVSTESGRHPIVIQFFQSDSLNGQWWVWNFSIQSDWVEKFLRLGTNPTHGDPYLVSSTSHNHDDCVILVMELEELYENPVANFQIGFICCNFDRTIYYCSLSAIF